MHTRALLMGLSVLLTSIAAPAYASTSRVVYVEPTPGVDVVSVTHAEDARRSTFTILLSNANTEDRAVYYRVKWLDPHHPKLAGMGEAWHRTVVAAGQNRVVLISTPVAGVGEYFIQVGFGGEMEHAQKAAPQPAAAN